MNYIIIDDEPAAIDVLTFHLKSIPFMVHNTSFRDALDALEYLQNNQVDLIFLDINMPKLSGIDFPKFLQNPPLIIFTTAYSEYAIKSYELNAIDYLLKPISFDRLLQSVMKAKQALETSKVIDPAQKDSLEQTSDHSIFIKSGSEFHQLAIQDIKYVESDGNYVTFHNKKRSTLARYKLSEVLNLLPNQLFTRVHRSYIVALKHIDIVKKHCVVIDGREIPISANYREGFISIIENMKT